MSLPHYAPDVAPENCRIIADTVQRYLSIRDAKTLYYICSIVDDWGVQDKYSEPMVWIGIYIAAASSVCILAMVADMWHGFRNNELWFPCRYFSLNAASITVITVTMKLPVDISTEMPSYMDQAAKLGSLAFMCTMMANLMPSLASMDNKTLLANVIGLSILVITIIVNIIIDLNTGVIRHDKFNFVSSYSSMFDCVMVTYIYMAMILLLLIIMVSSSLTIPTSKEILEAKYQVTNKASLTDQSLQQTQISIVEKLRQHVRRYWVMAETGSPQFFMASNPLSAASGVICVIVLVMNILVVLEVPFGSHGGEDVYRSAYRFSVLFIIITQSIGVMVGTAAPIFRSFSVLSFNLVTKSNTNPLKVFKVEKYWTQKLYEWKQSHIPFLSISRRSRTLFYISSDNILDFCIILQKVTVIACKVIWLIPIVVSYCWNSVKERLFTPSMASTTDDIIEDLRNYVLQIYYEMELAERTLKGISNSINPFILKAEKEQNNNLLELLEKSTGFEGVERFDTSQVEPLPFVGLVNSWSLPIITLTCIAVALPNIRKDKIDRLLESVGVGLSYSHLVDESLNTSSEYINIQKATKSLWHEVEYNCRWLNNTLLKSAFEGKTAKEILNWFADKARELIEFNESSNGKMVENSSSKELIAANSMYRIAKTMLPRVESNIEPISEEQQDD
nr:pentatricopeptide repeat-containing protein [Tanacetum cinerariifolium]